MSSVGWLRRGLLRDLRPAAAPGDRRDPWLSPQPAGRRRHPRHQPGGAARGAAGCRPARRCPAAAPAVLRDNPGQGCGLCPANLVLVHSEPGLVDGLLRVGLAPGLVWRSGWSGRPWSPPGRFACHRPARRCGVLALAVRAGGLPVSAARSDGCWLTPCSSLRQDGGKTPAVVDANPRTAI